MHPSPYSAMVTSDWNECLAPSGPFDAIAFHYPDHRPLLESVFRDYTGNRIPLAAAIDRIGALLPGGITQTQMDAFLARGFTAYRGVRELIEWCAGNGVLFMINTTAVIGFFQRALALKLLPPVAALAAHPWVRYAAGPADPATIFDLFATSDKARHSAAAAAQFNIPPERIIVIGDSGGDGPHFEWGAHTGARLVASMAKPSLQDYCRRHAIRIDHHFGCTYAEGQPRDPEREQGYDFKDLIPVIEKMLHEPGNVPSAG